MSRLEFYSTSGSQAVVESLYRDLEHRIVASPPGLCPVDLAAAFLKMCHAQTCGKCVPCRIGLRQLELLIEDVLEGRATMDTLTMIERTAQVISDSADCAIGYEAANMVLKGIKCFRDDYVSHVKTGLPVQSGPAGALCRPMSCGGGYPRLHRPGGLRPVCRRRAAHPEGQSLPRGLRSGM